MEKGTYTKKLSYYSTLDGLRVTELQPQSSGTLEDVQAFIKRVTVFGLQEHEALVLADKFVLNKTFREITADHGFVNVKTAYEVYQMACEKVRKGMLELQGYPS